jgi:hypothetical protein
VISLCANCGQEFDPSQGQVCDACEQAFCTSCTALFEACEICGRIFCSNCALQFIQIPSAITLCNDCYSSYLEDTGFLFD